MGAAWPSLGNATGSGLTLLPSAGGAPATAGGRGTSQACGRGGRAPRAAGNRGQTQCCPHTLGRERRPSVGESPAWENGERGVDWACSMPSQQAVNISAVGKDVLAPGARQRPDLPCCTSQQRGGGHSSGVEHHRATSSVVPALAHWQCSLSSWTPVTSSTTSRSSRTAPRGNSEVSLRPPLPTKVAAVAAAAPPTLAWYGGPMTS